MPRSWQYPRWRRILLQAILWLVLAAAVAVAALVSRQRIQSNQIDLSRRITIGPAALQLPSKWIIIPDADNRGITAHEPQDSDQQRAMTIRIEPINSNFAAIAFLLANGFSQDQMPSIDTPPGEPPMLNQSVTPIQIAGSPGLLKKMIDIDPAAPDSEQASREEMTAVVMLPAHHQGIAIHFSCPPQADEENTTLFRQIAAGISMNK